MSRSTWWLLGFTIAVQIAVLLDVRVPVLRPVGALIVLGGVPVLVLVRRVRWGAVPRAHAVVLSCAAVLLGVLLVALLLNTLLPRVGVAQPLARIPLTLASLAADVALLLWRPARALTPPGGPFPALRLCVRVGAEPPVLLAAVSVLLSAIGAVRLNNGASSAVAAAGLLMTGIALMALFVRRRTSSGGPGDITVPAATLALVSVALLLGTSLRGWVITGHDIQREYMGYLLTQDGDRWQMEEYSSAYNACLSVNVLPTVLANLTDLSGVVVFKVLLQVAFALVPVTVLLLASRLLPRNLAVLGAVFFVAFPTFYNDMPYLVRQEVAFIFLAAALLVAGEASWSVRRRRVLVVALTAGVVLSHYSTTYMLLLALGGGCAGAVGTRLLLRGRGPRRFRGAASSLVALHPIVVIVVAVSAWAWTSPATGTGGHLEETVVSTWRTVSGEQSGPGSSDLAYGVFGGAQATAEERLDLYVEETLRERAEEQTGLLVDPLTQDQLSPDVVEPELAPLTHLGRGLERLGIDVEGVSGSLRLAAAALLQLFLLVGLGAMVLRRRLFEPIDLEGLWIRLGSLLALGLCVVIPSLSTAYGVLRAFQQALLVLAPLVAVGAWWCFAWTRRWATVGAVSAGLAVHLLLTGALLSLTGGYQARIAVSSSGQYHDLYYVSDAEVAATAWLGLESGGRPVQSEVVSDKVSVSRMQAQLGSRAVVSDEFFPSLLRTGTYVYLGATQVDRGVATIFWTGDLISYRYPTDLLDEELDLVYSNDSARIYR